MSPYFVHPICLSTQLSSCIGYGFCPGSIRISYFSVNSLVVATQPVKLYKNADLDKLRMLKENQGKAGVYIRINLKKWNKLCGK
jgi:hypothetical protein